MNYIADREVSPEIPSHRQTTLDTHIRARIQSELESLRAEEESVRQEIEHALEKENLDRERGSEAEDGDTTGTLGDVKVSAALLGDLDEIRRKAEGFRTKQESDNKSLAARTSGEALMSCYKCVKKKAPKSIAYLSWTRRINASTPLDCWREVNEFKASVAQMEQVCTLYYILPYVQRTRCLFSSIRNTSIPCGKREGVITTNPVKGKGGRGIVNAAI